MSNLPTLAYLSSLSGVLVALVGIFFFRHQRTVLKLAVLLFVVFALSDICAYVLLSAGTNNLFINHIITLLHFSTFAFILYHWSDPTSRFWLKWSAIGYVLFWSLSKLFLERLDQFDQYSMPLSALILTVFALKIVYRYTLGENDRQVEPSQLWFSAGIVIYFPSQILISAAGNLILELPAETMMLVLYVHWSIVIVANLLYALSFYLRSREFNRGRLPKLQPSYRNYEVLHRSSLDRGPGVLS